MFRLPEIKSCCFCFKLKVGSLVIAIFSLIAALVDILIWVTGVRPFHLTHMLYQLYNYDSCDNDEDCRDFVQQIVTWVTVVMLIIDGLHVIMCSLLIHGIRKEKPRLYVPYLSWQATRLVISFCFFMALTIIFCSHFVAIVSYLVIIGVCWALDFYFFLVINSHRVQVCRVQGSAPLELIE